MHEITDTARVYFDTFVIFINASDILTLFMQGVFTTTGCIPVRTIVTDKSDRTVFTTNEYVTCQHVSVLVFDTPVRLCSQSWFSHSLF